MRTRRRRLSEIATVGLAAVALAACGEDATSGEPLGSADMALEVTDSPGDIDRAWADFVSATLFCDTGTTDLILDRTEIIELSALNGTTREITPFRSVAPPGDCGAVAVVPGEVAVQTEDDSVFARIATSSFEGMVVEGTITCTGCGSQGEVLVTLPEGGVQLQDGDQLTLVLDFDLEKSLTRTEGGWNLDPVISSSFKERSGTVEGTVSLDAGVSVPSCGGVSRSVADFVPLFAEVETPELTRSGEVATDGTYAVTFIQATTHTVSFERSVTFGDEELLFDGTSSASGGEVTVTAGMQSTIDFTITSATCQAL